MGRRPKARGRNVHGIVLLNKAAGITSNDSLQQVKRLFNANRAGHTGSLDKPATGMLPICLGEATKLSAFLLDADKHYIADCQLGITTSTGDASGEVIQTRAVPDLCQDKLEQVLQTFLGEIEQIPPMFSAIKQQGQPLYRLAYQGKEVERKPRQIRIHDLALLSFDAEHLRIRVHCSKGTYIRSLVMDIGEALGCGAHVSMLHRDSVAGFSADKMVSMPDLVNLAEQGQEQLDQCLLEMDQAVAHLPKIELEPDSVLYVSQGQAVTIPRAPTQGLLRMYRENGEFLGIGRILSDGRVAPKRMMNIRH